MTHIRDLCHSFNVARSRLFVFHGTIVKHSLVSLQYLCHHKEMCTFCCGTRVHVKGVLSAINYTFIKRTVKKDCFVQIMRNLKRTL